MRSHPGERFSMWILCQVIDNFGDAGVCWRLARELARSHPVDPTLIIDSPETLAAIEPRMDASQGDQRLDGVHIVARFRLDQAPCRPLPDVVLSAFGCAPPGWLRQSLAGGPARPIWVQLEYLSAEDWIEHCHGLVSVKPSDAALEHFLYPGFTERTSGLLRERGLIERRDAFRAADGPTSFLASIGASPKPGQRVFSVFCYPSAPLLEWFEALAAGPADTLVCIAGGAAEDAVRTRLGRALARGERHRMGRVELLRLPMLSQDDYDRLLWSCSFNAVRGEDSWVRAHWAGVPFTWQAYPQEDGAHLKKIEAFLGRMAAGASRNGAQDQALINALMRSWNDPARHGLGPAWLAFDAKFASLVSRYEDWTASLTRQSGLPERLTAWCLDRLQ